MQTSMTDITLVFLPELGIFYLFPRRHLQEAKTPVALENTLPFVWASASYQLRSIVDTAEHLKWTRRRGSRIYYDAKCG